MHETARLIVSRAALLTLAMAVGGCPATNQPPGQLKGGPISHSRAIRLADRAAAGPKARQPQLAPLAPLAKALRDAVLHMLAHPDPAIRSAAADRLRELASPRATEALSMATRDPRPDVRAAAAGALGWTGDKRAVAPLIAGLTDADHAVRAAAAKALGRFADPRAVIHLRVALKDGAPGVRAAAATSLGAAPDNRAVAPLLGALRDRPSVAARAAAALGRIARGPAAGTATKPLIAALSYTSDQVRHAAAGALGAIGDRRAVPSLIRRLGDSHSAVRCAAAYALGRLKDPRARAALRAALAIPDDALRPRVREALAKLQTATTAPSSRPKE